MAWLVHPEVSDDLLGFINIQGQVVDLTAVDQVVHLVSRVRVIVVLGKAHYCCAVCKSHNLTGSHSSTAVVRVNNSGLRMQP